MFSFVKDRPPLVVFFLCMVTVTVTIFCFAFYIKHTDPIPDTDRIYDWKELLKHFSNLDVCVQANDTVKGKEVENSFIEMTKVQTVIRLNNSDWLKKFTTIGGLLTLESWRTKCPKNYSKPSSLFIYFSVPKQLETNDSTLDVCATIEGPAEYLPKFIHPNCNTSIGEKPENVTFLTTSTKTKLSTTFCKEGILTEIYFHSPRKDNFDSYLSENEKSRIYLHLLWTSYTLLFLLLIIIVYGTLQSDYIYDKYHKWVPFRNR